MGRNPIDTRFSEYGDEIDEGKEVFCPEPGPASAHCLIGIGGKEVCPAHGHRMKGAIGKLDGHPVFSPEALGNDEAKGVPPEGVEGMGDTNLSLISCTTCS